MDINVKMIQRADTSTNWILYNPILSNGEIGYDTDKQMFKIGNGSSNWTSLPYYNEIIDGGTYETSKVSVLMANSSWYKSTTKTRSQITDITILNNNETLDIDNMDESWDASADTDGSVMCYISGNSLYMVGNKDNKIYANEDSSYAFSDKNGSDYFASVTAINGVENLDTKNMVDGSAMFKEMTTLTSIDLNTWNTQKLENAEYMFGSESNMAFITINIDKWNTSSLRNTNNMFRYNKNLTSLDVSNWDVRNLEEMHHMFAAVEKLPAPDFSKWQTDSLVDIGFAFYGAFKSSGSNVLDVSGLNTKKVWRFDHWIAHRYSPLVGYENLDTSSATNMGAIFHGCSNSIIDVSNMDVSKNENFSQFFEACHNVTQIIGLEKFDTSNGITFDEMFNDCRKLSKLDLSSFDTRKANCGITISTNGGKSYGLIRMLCNCNVLQEVKVGEKFSIDGDGTYEGTTLYGTSNVFFAPSSNYITGADGYWYTEDGTQYAPENIPDEVANTYYAVNPNNIQ